MKSVFFKILITVVMVLIIYTYIGQIVPQIPRGYPTPEEAKITPGISSGDLVAIGENLVGTRGCMTCHTIGGTEKGRCPNLADIGRAAATRHKGYNAEQYLLRRLIDPDFSAIAGYPKIMPKVWQPPIALTWPEVKAVTAYLESLGGNVTIGISAEDLQDKPHDIKFPDGADVTVAKAKAARKIDPAAIKEGHDVMMSIPEKERCISCHKIGKEMPEGWSPVPGGASCPDLSAIGAVRDIDYVKQKIRNPQSLPTVTGYPKGMMPMDFKEQMKKLYGDKWEQKLDALAGFVISHNGTQKLPPEISPWIIAGMLVLAFALNLFPGSRGG